MLLPLGAQAKNVEVAKEKISGVEWQVMIKNVERGPAATLILRKNGKNQCKENAVAYAKFNTCATAKAGTTYANQALKAIKKAIPGL